MVKKSNHLIRSYTGEVYSHLLWKYDMQCGNKFNVCCKDEKCQMLTLGQRDAQNVSTVYLRLALPLANVSTV